MSITFPDGYVAPISGPVDLVTDDGYALKDPGQGRFIGAFALPAAGAGLGALIGHSVANSQATTITSTLPPGCTGLPPGCLTSSLTIPGSTTKSTMIGTMIGATAGMIASLVLLTSSHNFYLDVGSPVEMVLRQPLFSGTGSGRRCGRAIRAAPRTHPADRRAPATNATAARHRTPAPATRQAHRAHPT
jgi:hypothetical protein